MKRTFLPWFIHSSAVLLITLLVACSSGKQPAPVTQTAPNEPKPSQPEVAPTATSTPSIAEERLIHQKWKGDLDGIAKRRILRVLAVPGKLGVYFDGSQMEGAIYDFVREFEIFLNKKLNTGNLRINVAFIPVARERLLPMLQDGGGDLVATLMAVSEERENLVDFSDPLYDKAKGIIVSGPAAPPLSQLEDLAGKEVYYYKNTVPYKRLSQLSDKFTKEGKAPIKLTAADENLLDDDLMEMVNAGLVPMTVAEDKLAQFWAKLLPGLKLHQDIVFSEGSLAWAMPKNTPQLKAVVNEFVRDHRVGTAFGNTIGRKYLRDVKWVKNAAGGEDLARFQQLVKFFKEYGDKYNLPYLLLAAQGYQESRLDQTVKSSAGAVGVMQIKPSTAAGDPIGIPDVHLTDRNIEAGSKYLRYMVNQYYKNEPMDRVTKGLFALASYNAGPNRIQKLRKQATAQGYDANRWFNNVEVIASREIGRETVTYVSNIYKYYLSYTMIMEREAQRQASREKASKAGYK
jgi:membrane-bound lytic murein transglycosylase MltF